MMVGTKAIATLSTGYLNALEYAKERVQGADLTQPADKTAPRVTITHHPDVRRSLLTQKAYAEALRALVLYTATVQDSVDARRGTPARQRRPGRARSTTCCCRSSRATARSGRGRCSAPSRCRRSAAPASCRTTRSSSTCGTPRSTPSTRAPRRSRAWTCSSARSSRTRARRCGTSPTQIQAFVEGEAGNGRLKEERELLGKALDDAQAIVGVMVEDLMAGDPRAEAATSANIYKVGLNTTRLLMVLGDVVCAWLLLRQAEVALTSWTATSRRRDGVLRGQGRGGPVVRPARCCPSSPPSGRSPRPPTST